MASWIILAVGAQLISAVVSLVDKYIVTSEKAIPSAFVYAFITCLLSGASIAVFLFNGLALPLDGVHFPDIRNVEFPTLTIVAFSLLSAFTFFSGLASLFSALRKADASDVVPVVGAVSALATFGLGLIFLDGSLAPNFIVGMLLLALGTFLVSRFRFTWQTALVTIHSGIFFGFHYVTFKGLLDITSFDNAFFWSRIGLVLFALSLLFVPDYLEKINVKVRGSKRHAGLLVILNKVLAGVAAIMILKATELGDAAVVQALGGLQFVFILLIGLFIGPKTHADYGENSRSLNAILHKTIFVSIIVIGFFILFV